MTATVLVLALFHATTQIHNRIKHIRKNQQVREVLKQVYSYLHWLKKKHYRKKMKRSSTPNKKLFIFFCLLVPVVAAKQIVHKTQHIIIIPYYKTKTKPKSNLNSKTAPQTTINQASNKFSSASAAFAIA